MGVHYPTDVVGGFALGTAVVLLLAPLAQLLLTPVVAAVARSPRLGLLVHSRKALTVVAAAPGAVERPGPRNATSRRERPATCLRDGVAR